ncbi:MAG: DEAD/DEAH box helicase [Hyphomicrobiales bacterium]
MKFQEFNFEKEILESIEAMGFENASPIQEQAIPAILEKKDLIACAQTGTGKTAAFLLPVLNELIKTPAEGGIKVVILAPTRELALQIDQQLEGFSYFTDLSSIPIYGGGNGLDWENQRKALTKGADFIVATPGKLLGHLHMGYVDMSDLEFLILDEADRMLDMGFYDDIRQIISYMPEEKQSLMFSATMPKKIKKLAQEVLRDYINIEIAVSKPAEGVLQAAHLVYDDDKVQLIDALIQGKDLPSIIIFSSTKSKVNNIEGHLQDCGYDAKAIHSDLEQDEREERLLAFRNKQFQILVATDIMARGIDIDSISLVVNYDVPQDAEDYVHRVGRTARAANSGLAITFINKEDQYKFLRIERLIDTEVLKLPNPAGVRPGPEYTPINKKSSKEKKNNYQNKNQDNRKDYNYQNTDNIKTNQSDYPSQIDNNSEAKDSGVGWPILKQDLEQSFEPVKKREEKTPNFDQPLGRPTIRPNKDFIEEDYYTGEE